MLRRSRIWLFCFLAFFGGQLAHAQTWTQIGTMSANCGFFWSSTSGVVGGTDGIWVYRNNGWLPSNYPSTAYIPRAIHWINGALYCASGSSAWTSTDGGLTWTDITASIPERFAYDIYLGGDGKMHGVATD